MKIKIDGKECNMSFWSFLKGYVLSWLFLMGCMFVIAFLIGVFVA